MNELTLKSMAQQQRILSAFQKYGKRLFNFIRSRVSNDQDAEDILQDVWFQLISVVDTEPIEQWSAWLYRVSRNRIIDKQRKQKPLSLEDFAYENEEGELVFPDALLEEMMNPEIEFEKEYFQETLIKALSELPEKQRQVFIWNELEDLTLRAIAEKTGENLKTIISRKRYAVAHLKKRLQDLKD